MKTYWAKLDFHLGELRDLFHMDLETREDAVGERVSPANRKTGKKAKWRDSAPRWHDPEHGKSVRPWLLIPYVNAVGQDALKERLEAGKYLLASVEQRVATRELTPELLYEWGLLNRWAGALELVYDVEPSVGHQRSALAGGKAKIDDAEAHQRWFAHYFLRRYRRGQRREAEEAVERLVNAIIDGEISVPSRWDVTWFESYLKLEDRNALDYAKLRSAFGEHSLFVKDMKELVAKGAEGIPPIDLEFPDP